MNWFRYVGPFAVLLVLGLVGHVTTASAAYPISSDPMRVKQTYLDMININGAWAAAEDTRTPLIVAVVDTGVDLTHPDLAGRLVDGVNLLQPGAKPYDDNGHGTNVAGIIVAAMNNDKGIAGIAPNARIMPIKALESDGTGDEAKLGEGIKYAVDHGAKIVVLSLGLNKYSAYLQGIVQYAEDRNVLLVAAVGNESTSVKYPAAYPSVLAVGGVSPDRTADPRSNYGPELDIMAPWDVYTTALGGGYQYQDGSSMAAPQVAGAAALVWGKYPGMSAFQVRSQLEQTAEDLMSPGWDTKTGYGLLNVQKALTEPYKQDRFEPNDTQAQAALLPAHTAIKASLSSGQDQDWYAIDTAYDGQLQFWLEPEESSAAGSIRLRVDSGETFVAGGDSSQPFTVNVRKGRTYIQLQGVDSARQTALNYALRTDFIIYTDPFEDNDKQYKAFALPERSQTLEGTFHQKGDVDWFSIYLEHSGTMRIKVTTDTGRIDPMLFIQKEGEKSLTYDQTGDGGMEITSQMDVLPGQYYIRVSNVKDYIEPITGEYTLDIDYTPKLIDPNEPNDKSYQATFAALNSGYEGVFSRNEDVDWFEFRLTKESLAQVSLTNLPTTRILYATLYDSSMKDLGTYQSTLGNTSLAFEKPLSSGTYYIKLRANQWFMSQMYRLQINSFVLISGYRDIENHWAQSTISEMTSEGIISGYGNYRFAPDQPVSRAEAATVLARALHLTKQRELRFSDVATSFWGYADIAKVVQAGIVDGYPNGTFGPNRGLTRMEMTQMVAKALGMSGKLRGNSPYPDVGETYWGVGIVKQMAADSWISGYPDGSFHPEDGATRAEFLTIVAKLLNR
ncbi:S8 family serine peptidase [Paenibacillus oryzisoli]|uniref:S8 family serine peptidase n=1 Tax=Paenibacillus oryzisoli TaxID=1850517 RepID=UPI003D2BBA2E